MLGAALLLLSLTAAHASIMAIDLGSEYLKVSLIKPGRTPISIVVNEMSKRKSPALVGFMNGERLLGEEAFSFSVRFPETIISRAQDLLGKPADDPTIARMLKDYGLPYKVVPHPTRNVAAVEIKEGVVYSAEELVVSFCLETYRTRCLQARMLCKPVQTCGDMVWCSLHAGRSTDPVST